MEEWTRFALKEVGIGMSKAEARDHVSLMLARLVEDLRESQTDVEQKEKSEGKKPTSESATGPASRHALDRLDTGFTIQEVSAEFRALRASIVRLWQRKEETDGPIHLDELIRFNEAIDELWLHSISRYQTKVEQSKSWFVGVLAHDLRSPLSYVTGVLELLGRSAHLGREERTMVARGEASIKRTFLLIDNLLELTRLHLGSGLNLKLTRADIRDVADSVIHELKMIYQGVDLNLQTEGQLVGQWDSMRINQVMTNLVSNAIRYGQANRPITLSLEGGSTQVLIKVHNEGSPIPREVKEKLFKGFIQETEQGSTKPGSYGLGLYIVHEIAKAHHGSVEITSTEEQGTTFTVSLPVNTTS